MSYTSKYTPTNHNNTERTASLRDFDSLDAMLETETQENKTKPWNKLDKTQKIQKLHAYAEKYVREQSLPIKEEKVLKTFLKDQLEMGFLLKTKEVIYNKETREITHIPGLMFHSDRMAFDLRTAESAKAVSALKSLTPKMQKL